MNRYYHNHVPAETPATDKYLERYYFKKFVFMSDSEVREPGALIFIHPHRAGDWKNIPAENPTTQYVFMSRFPGSGLQHVKRFPNPHRNIHWCDYKYDLIHAWEAERWPRIGKFFAALEKGEFNNFLLRESVHPTPITWLCGTLENLKQDGLAAMTPDDALVWDSLIDECAQAGLVLKKAADLTVADIEPLLQVVRGHE